MRVAALYDVHGNLPALEAVLGALAAEPVDRVVVGGDVFPGPMAGECLERLLGLDLPVSFLYGNGERALLAAAAGDEPESVPEPAREAIRWLAARLDPRHGRLLAGWPGSVGLEIERLGEVLFCHATPESDTELFVRTTPEESLSPIFAGVGADLVVCGHTHMQFDRTVAGVRVVNAGSVGMPFGTPGAHWLLLAAGVELRRTEYDLERAAARIRGSGYPGAAEMASTVVDPPSEREMRERFGGGS